MRKAHVTILVLTALLTALQSVAEKPVPTAAGNRFPNIRASLDDGFFVLGEQLARGVLRSDPKPEEELEAVLLLSHALWGQKRYSEMQELLSSYDGDPGCIYWRARAQFELTEYELALKILEKGEKRISESSYAASSLRLKGFMLQKTGKMDAAEKVYQQFSTAFPEHPEWTDNRFDLAEIYALQKRVPEAMAVYEMLAEKGGKRTFERARLRLGHLLYTQGAADSSSAAREILSSLGGDEAVKLSNRIDALIDLAALEEKAGDREQAVLAMRKGIALSPDARQRVPLKLALARMLLRYDDAEGALKLLEECRAEAPNEVIAAELQLEKANALLQAGKFSESDAAYQVYLDVADDPDGVARAYFGKGLALWELKRFAEAGTVFDKVEKVDSSVLFRADALFKAGDSYYQAGKFEEAEKRYGIYVSDYSASDKMPDALYQQGLCQVNLGRLTEALNIFADLEINYVNLPVAENAALRAADVMSASQDYETALAKYAAIGQAYSNVAVRALSQHQQGLVLYRLGRFDESLNAFETVISDFPESEYAAQAYYMRGFCLYLLGQVEDAVKTCQEFITQYPDSQWTPEVIFWLAEQFFNQGNYAEAEPLFLRIYSDFKANRLAARSLYWAGRAAAAQSNYTEAVKRYSEVARSYSASDILPQTRFAQGDALTELGEFSQAILAFEEIIKNYPENYLVNAAWGRKGDCHFSLASDNPKRYAEAMSAYQSILDRPSSPMSLKLEAEHKIGRCLEKTNVPDRAFNRYMNVVYSFINENVEHSPYSVMWFSKSAFSAATLKEQEKAWVEAVRVYERVAEAGVPAREEALKRIERIKKENWLLFQTVEEMDHVGNDE